MPLWDVIGRDISTAVSQDFVIQATHPVGGGCINQAYRVQGDGQDYFVKLNDVSTLSMFEAEAAGLQELAAAVRVPRPVCWGSAQGRAYLVLEYLCLTEARADAMETLGRQLAQLHRTATRPRFGWDRNNTIGSTDQINTPDENWIRFWRRQRLGFQLELAVRQGYGAELRRRGEQLMARVDDFFQDYTAVPALLHGDLWVGNVAGDDEGRPVLFDPAVYYGDREADIAMTELFGGFSSRFYAAYREAYPLHEGYRLRRILYNLYHILNHLNLFGRGYLSRATQMMDALLAETS